MKYKISKNANGLHVDASVPAGQQQKLMAELEKCAAGTCTCPSTQFDKLQKIDIEPGETSVAIELKAKPEEVLDQADIQRCLEHTAKEIQR